MSDPAVLWKGMSRTSADSIEDLSLDQAATHILEECRMVLPGIQALFGFQLIAVFSAEFARRLSPGEQRIHLVALTCVALAIGLVMVPAALHRQLKVRQVSERFVRHSSRFLMLSMIPLAVGTALDVYLVSRMIIESKTVPGLIAGGVLVLFTVLWAVIPRTLRLK